MHGEQLILLLAIGLSAALVLGVLTQRIGLSPIVGYLLAGIVIGPYTPGFTANQDLASQLAEVGVILLMFGVGLHFHPSDLLAVKGVALPGALGQSVAATALGAIVGMTFGWSLGASLVLGASISVASTVVLTRVLIDNEALDTSPGRIAIGWLIAEDILTVVLLVLLPILARSTGATNAFDALPALGWATLKLILLFALLFGVGGRIVPWALGFVARMRSGELFTLAVLALALAIAALSAIVFGASVALGAFLAGMVVSRSPLSHQAAADALPMRDAFAVVFFLSMGMLFDPGFILERPALVAVVLAIILVAKPLVALAIVLALGRSVRTALTVAVGLAQIGEFSFIISEGARALNLVPQEATNVLVAAAILSISLNPAAFRAIGPMEAWLKRRPRLWALLQRRAEARARATLTSPPLSPSPDKIQAIVVGYGPAGQTACDLLRDFDIDPIVIELNLDTVTRLTGEGHRAIFGDASRREILESAGIKQARYLLVTQPALETRAPVISSARELNPAIRILSRARYLREKPALEMLGVNAACYEEAESAVGLASLLLAEVGAPAERIEAVVEQLRDRFAIHRARPALETIKRPSVGVPTESQRVEPIDGRDDRSTTDDATST